MRRLLRLWIAVALSLATALPIVAAEPDELRESDAANVGRERAATILGRTRDAVRPVDTDKSAVMSVGARRFWTGVFRGKADEQAFVAVDLASGEALDGAAFQAEVERAIGREPRVTPPARARVDDAKRKGASPLLAYVLEPPDYSSAVKSVKAAHPRSSGTAIGRSGTISRSSRP